MRRHIALIGSGLAVTLLIAGCSGSSASSAPTSGPTAATPTAASSPAATASAETATPTASTAAATGKVNANTASEAELQAAFEAAGISNAAKWAKEVAEYRPYAADPTWAALRQELIKYNIDQAVFDQIIAVLEV
jgi:hypothetical protein